MRWTSPLPLVLCGLGCGPGVGLDDGTSAGSSSTASTSMPTITVTSGVTSASTSVGPTSADTSSSSGSDFITPTADGCGDDTGGGSLAECSTWVQDCCQGDKCMPWANDGGDQWNATRCSPVAPDPAGPGEPCTVEGSPVSGLDTCDADSLCWEVDPRTLMGECVTMCTGSPEEPQCPEGYGCRIWLEDLVQFCLPRCDPTADDCGINEACTPVGNDFLCEFDPINEAQVGDGCDPRVAWANCSPNYVCIDAAEFPGCEYSDCCSPYCDAVAPDGEDVCDAIDPAMICEPLFGPGEAPPGLDHVGVCRLP